MPEPEPTQPEYTPEPAPEQTYASDGTHTLHKKSAEVYYEGEDPYVNQSAATQSYGYSDRQVE